MNHDSNPVQVAELEARAKAAEGNGKKPPEHQATQVKEHYQVEQAADPLAWIEDYEVTDEDAADLDNAIYITENLFIQGHCIFVAAESNGGKTTIVLSLLPAIVSKGYKVLFIHVDAAGDDIKRERAMAKEQGWRLLSPDFKKNSNRPSVESVIGHLRAMADTDADLRDLFIVLDTVKKFCSTMDKTKAADFMKLVRKLTARGVTIVMLGHTNKNAGDDGKKMFEGVGDFRNDCDDLFYFDVLRHEDRSQTVTTRPDKVRGTFKPITFEIGADRSVTQKSEVIDIQEDIKAREQLRKDADGVAVILEAINAGQCSGLDIKTWIKDRRPGVIGQNRIDTLLHRYSSGPNQKWFRRQRFDGTGYDYALQSFFGP